MSAFVVSNDRSDGTPNVPDANATGKWRSILWRRNRESGQGASTSIYLWDEALTTPDSVYLKWVPIGNFITTTDLLSLQAGSTKMSITSSSGNVYFDVVESALTISNISGNLPLSKLPSTVALVDAANTFSLHNTFSAGLTGALTGNATTATTLANSRSIYLTGDATGSVSGVDWATDVTINTTVTHSAVGSSSPYWNASHLMSRVIGNQTPADGDVYAWDQSEQEWAPVANVRTTLADLIDVSISSPTNGQFIQYDSSSSAWESSTPTTSDITEGTNLYYTDARWDTRLAAKTTDNLTEGSSSLYFTDARARTALSAAGDITYSSTTGVFSHTDAVQSVNAATGTVVLDTDDIAEGSTNLYYTEARVATSGALLKTGGTMSGHLSLSDNVQLQFGTGNDLQIYHDGSNSAFIDAGSGGFVVGASAFEVKNAATNEHMILATEDASVTLYSDGVEKFSTASGGVNVVGDITVSGMTDGRDVAADGTKLDGISGTNTGDEVAATETVAGVVELATTAETTAGTDTARAVTPAGVQAAVDEILDGAPAALDTLNELAAAIDDDASYAATITTALGTKVTKVGTPVGNQVGVWTGDGTLEGDADLVFDGANLGIGNLVPDEQLHMTGRVHLGQTSAPATTTDKLYNVGGALYWNGTDVTSGGGGGGHAIKDEGGAPLTTRSIMNFVGELVKATDNSTALSTDITIDAKTAWLYG